MFVMNKAWSFDLPVFMCFRRGSCKKRTLGLGVCEVGLRTRAYYVLSGSVLSVWTKVEQVLANVHGGGSRMQIIRMQTEDGDRIIGTLIPASAKQRLSDVLSQDSEHTQVHQHSQNPSEHNAAASALLNPPPPPLPKAQSVTPMQATFGSLGNSIRKPLHSSQSSPALLNSKSLPKALPSQSSQFSYKLGPNDSVTALGARSRTSSLVSNTVNGGNSSSFKLSSSSDIKPNLSHISSLPSIPGSSTVQTVKQEIKQEIKTEPIKQEIKEEIKEEVKVEMQDEIIKKEEEEEEFLSMPTFF